MKEQIARINGIAIFKLRQYGKDMFMLKKGWATIGTYYTLKEAKKAATKK